MSITGKLIFFMNRQADLLEQAEQDISAAVMRDGAKALTVLTGEPTEAMIIAGNNAISSKYPNQRTVAAIYKAMLKAAPTGEK